MTGRGPEVAQRRLRIERAEAAAARDTWGSRRPCARGPALLGGVSLSDLERDFVRRAILVSDSNATLFSGPLRDELDVRGDASEDDLLTLVVVTLGSSAADATANLMAPVLVNHRTRKAAQVVLDDLDLPIKAPLAAAVG